MHDPMVVAFEFPRPWPSRDRASDARPGQRRWQARHYHDCASYGCEQEHAGQRFFPWWRPGSYRSTWRIAGRGWYWPALVTVWHVEPGGRDSGDVCRHYVRTRQPDGTYTSRTTSAWRWHVHHWRITVPALQAARRRLLTRCTWCGGRSRPRDVVNVSHQWDGERGPWWRGERGLYHVDCSEYEHARMMCVCDTPRTGGSGYGRCVGCGKFAGGDRSPSVLERRRLLAAVPRGSRDPAVLARVRELAGLAEVAGTPA